MIVRLIVIGFSFILALPSPATASAGKSSFVFLRIGSGSRPAALAEAVTASGSDITSAFYNPALQGAFAGKGQAVFMHNSFFSDVSQDYLGLAARADKFTYGGYLILGRVGGFERRNEVPDISPMGGFDENNFVGAFIVSYSSPGIDVGVGLKFAYENIDYSSANALMFDAGIRVPINDEIVAGGALKNVGSRPEFENVDYTLPREYRLGLSYKPELFDTAMEFMADAVFYSDTNAKFNFAGEYTHPRHFVLRAGYGAGYDSRGLSFGGGLFYRTFRFDYAFVLYKNNLGNAHRFTVVAGF